MRKTIVLFCFLKLVTNIYAQVTAVYTYDRYYAMLDSLLIIFRVNIENDLSLSEYSISKQALDDIQTIANSFILEVFFIPKHSSIIALVGATSSMNNKFFKQNRGFRFVKRAYFDTFRSDIQNNNKLPYDIIDYFSCKFITSYDNSPKHHAIYGEYKFRANENENLEIVEKKIEILQDRDAILHKYRSDF